MTELSPEARRFLGQAKAGQVRAPEGMRERVRAAMEARASLPPSAASGIAKWWMVGVIGVGVVLGGYGGWWLEKRESVYGHGHVYASENESGARSTAASHPAPLDPVNVPVPVHEPASVHEPAGAQEPARPAAVSGDTLKAELSLLSHAESSLRAGNPTAALRDLSTHRRRFPHGQLQHERQGLQLIAQCNLGRDVARPLTRYLSQPGHDVLAARVREACHKRR